MSSSDFPGFEHFFRLSDPLANRPLRLRPIDDDWLGNKEAWLLFYGRLQLSGPLKMRAAMGGQATDFLWSQFPPLLCVSERVVRLLENEEFVGWATYPVEVYDRKGAPLPGYYGLAITGPVLDHDLRRSPLVTLPPIVPRGMPPRVYRGLYFAEEKWDGSDFFLVKAGWKVVTRRVAEAFRRNRITNIRLTPVPEVEMDAILFRI